MNIFLEDEEIEIIEPLRPSEDKGLIVIEHANLVNHKDKEPRSDLVKEMTAYDVMEIGRTSASAINGVPLSTADKYANGDGIVDPEVKARVLSRRYDIQDTAVAKLMDTLNLIDPSKITKQRDLIQVATGLGSIVDKMSDKGNNDNKPQVVLHLYAPDRKTEKEYKTIDV